MATAQTIINDALKEIGVLGSGKTATADQSEDALRALNRLMEKWSNAQPFAFFADEVSLALTGQASFTIGPTGDVVALRPIKIQTATALLDTITYPVRVLDNQLWDSIPYKAQTGAYPEAVYYEGTMPDGIVHLWPVCTGCTIKLRITNVVYSFPTLGTDLILPPGYEEALIKNLAVNISPQYFQQVSPVTMQAAKSALTYIERANVVIPTLTLDPALTGSNRNSFWNYL